MNRLNQNWDRFIAPVVGPLTAGALVYVWGFSSLLPSDKVGITTGIGTLVLVIATAVYAWHTRRMAEEMRKQRYAALLPIIDIELSQDADDLFLRGYHKEENPPKGLNCVLCNVGVGPAVDVHTFVIHSSPSHERYLDDLGTRPSGDRTSKPRNLSLEKDGNDLVLTVSYRDVYGRDFKSKRKLLREEGSWKLGPLQVEEVGGND